MENSNVRHVAFNPTNFMYGYSPLGAICSNLEEEGWVLYKVVPNHQYESIAVFVKIFETPPSEEKETENTTEEEHEGGYI